MSRFLAVSIWAAIALLAYFHYDASAESPPTPEEVQQRILEASELQKKLMQESQGIPEVDPEMMQKIMDAMRSGDPQAAMQEALKDHEIDMSQYRQAGRTACSEERFMDCKSGYSCTSTDHQGKKSTATILGKKGAKCHVTMKNEDGSTGECLYTQSTMHDMLKMYNADKIKMGDAMALSKRILRECELKDANGEVIKIPEMN